MELDIKVIKKVQGRLIRSVSDIQGMSYEERLKDAGLRMLREQWERRDCIETFKTLKGFDKVEKEVWFREAGKGARLTRTTVKVREEGEQRREHVLQVDRARPEIRRNLFTMQVAKRWNEPPA